MSAAAPRRRHRLRWGALAVLVILATLVIALAVHIHNLLQPQRFTGLLQRELSAYGIEVTLDAPATPTLFPHPGVHLQGFSISNRDAATPILRADGATIIVPWRALLHGEAAVERVDIDTPRIDIGQLRALLARLPAHRGPPALPTIAAGVQMSNGTLSDAGQPILFDVGIETGQLMPGRPFHLTITAHAADGQPISASLETVPIAGSGSITFKRIKLAFSKQPGLHLQLAGQGQWRGGTHFALDLEGHLQHQALAMPAAPASSAPTASTPSSANAATPLVDDSVAVQVTPATNAAPLSVAVKLSGSDTHANFRFQPTEFGGWWHQVLTAAPGHPPGPLPFTGHASVQKLDIDGFKATGLTIDADPRLAPASASTAGAAPDSAHP